MYRAVTSFGALVLWMMRASFHGARRVIGLMAESYEKRIGKFECKNPRSFTFRRRPKNGASKFHGSLCQYNL